MREEDDFQRPVIETVDLTINPKQSKFFNDVVAASHGLNPYRYFFYGGAIRGGKTFVCLTALVVLCRMFPYSKWHIVRKDFSSLKDTTIPSLLKILGSANVHWNRDSANYHVTFENGSKIFFVGENKSIDPDLNGFLGLESNGFFLEQIEEISKEMFNMAIQRAGSWYISPMPKPIILSTFNPTNKWVKKDIYLPHNEGKLLPPYYYLQALPNENPKVTAEQWAGWQNMGPEEYKRFVEGSWEFGTPDNLFIYAYNPKKHLDASIDFDINKPLYLSFDFNVEPITCLAAQHDVFDGTIHILQEYRLLNSDIFKICERIKADHGDKFLIVTGDASGKNRTAITRGNRNYYHIIQQELDIPMRNIQLPGANPSIDNTRALCNALLSRHPHYKIHPRCQFFIGDLEAVTVDDTGDIDKRKDAHKTHLLDCWRYYNYNYHRKFVTLPQS